MAVKEANSKYKSFTFNGVSAADYGVYVTDVNVFNSAERAVEYITIPGRNGSFALDHGRFENITVVYDCALGQGTDVDFATAISDFRNALASAKGYQRLEDDMNPDEYRMAVFAKGLEAPTLNQQTATFKVEFNCKPQRYLKSGESPRTIGGEVTNTQTKSGAVVSLESDGGDAVTSLVAQIEPVQAGSGDPSPTNVRPITGHTSANVTVAGKNLFDSARFLDAVNWAESGGVYTGDSDRIASNKGGGLPYLFKFNEPISERLTLSLDATTNKTYRTGYFYFNYSDGTSSYAEINTSTWKHFTMTSANGKSVSYVSFTGSNSTTMSVKNVQLEVGASETDYEPYKGNSYHVSFGSAGTVYGGTVDVVTGVLTVTHKMHVFDGTETLPFISGYNGVRFRDTEMNTTQSPIRDFIASTMKGAEARGSGGTSPCIKTYSSTTGADTQFLFVCMPDATDAESANSWLQAHPTQVVYPITPKTYQLTAQEVELLTGNNNVWADTGDTTLTYGRDPNKIVNPTLFDASPLLEVYGYGDITLGSGGVVSIANDVLVGDVIVNNGGRYSFTTEPYTESFMYKAGYLENGDIITLAPSDIHLNIATQASIASITASKTSGYDVGVDAVKVNSNNASVIVSWPEETFTAGTSKDLSAVVHVDIPTINTSGAIISIDLSATISYNAANRTITRTIQTPSVTAYDTLIKLMRTTADLGRITAYSTAPAYTEPLYFDLDIGEAYAIEDGVPVSINNAVSFGTVLPVLKPGANTITRSVTITDLKIIPRWWKV